MFDLKKIFTDSKESAIRTIDEAIDNFKAKAFLITLSNEVLNQSIKLMLRNEKEIQSLELNVQDGCIDAKIRIKRGIANFDVKLRFSITRFEINKRNQDIEIKRLSDLGMEAGDWLSRIIVYIFRGIFAAIFKQDLLTMALKDKEGITIIGDSIHIDLAKLGVKDILLTAIANKLSIFGGLATRILDSSSTTLADSIEIIGAECKKGELVVTVQYAG